MVATPLLALIIPPLQAVAIMLPILLLQDVISVIAYRKSWDAWNLKVLIPGGLIGVAVTAGLFVITDYYTSTRFRPVKTISRASVTGHATNIIQGLAQGFQSTAAPALVIALAILAANELAGTIERRHEFG